MKKKLFSLYCTCILSLFAFAQTEGYRYGASIDSVSKEGFYNILLTPEINAHVKTDYSDLRIVNDAGRWIPHLIRTPNNEFAVNVVNLERKIIRKTINSQITELIIEGSEQPTSNLIINIKNAAVDRYCTLTGSDNMTDWFIINDSINIKPVPIEKENISAFKISFPPVAYRYFKVSINNVAKEPLNILTASTEGEVEGKGIPTVHPDIENPACIIYQKDSAKNSYLRVVQKEHYHFERIALKLSGAKYFNRSAAIYIPQATNHSFTNPGSLIKTIEISNNSTLEYTTPVHNADTFYIVIDNQDNPPLHIEQVTTSVHFKVATAYLEPLKRYRLILDNAVAVSPSYDLQLKDNIAARAIPLVNISQIEALNTQQIKKAVEKDNSLPILWIVIALAAVVLGFFTFRLVKELGNKKEERI